MSLVVRYVQYLKSMMTKAIPFTYAKCQRRKESERGVRLIEEMTLQFYNIIYNVAMFEACKAFHARRLGYSIEMY